MRDYSKIKAWQLAHLSRRLGYRAEEQARVLAVQAEEVSCTLTGLIKTVEKEVGLVGRSIAKLSSLLILSLSSVFGLQSNSAGLAFAV